MNKKDDSPGDIPRIRGSLIKDCPISDLRKAETNTRLEYPEEDLIKLRHSVGIYGVQQSPIGVKKEDGTIHIHAGWGRVQAAILEGITVLNVKVYEDLTSKDQIIMSLTENEVRKDLFDDEFRIAMKRLRDDEGMTGHQIAKETGISEQKISIALSFYKLPDETQRDVEKEPDIRRYMIPEITQIVEVQSTKDKIKAGRVAIKLATRVPHSRMRDIVKQAKLGRGGPADLEKMLEEAQKIGYMTISLTLPDNVYKPALKYARENRRTIHEVIQEVMEERFKEET